MPNTTILGGIMDISQIGTRVLGTLCTAFLVALFATIVVLEVKA